MGHSHVKLDHFEDIMNKFQKINIRLFISSVFASFSTESHTVSVGGELSDRHTVRDTVIETAAVRGAAGLAAALSIVTVLCLLVTCHVSLSVTCHVSAA